ncbi:hypothetical protein ABZP36_008072 [Zizania latifolia]
MAWKKSSLLEGSDKTSLLLSNGLESRAHEKAEQIVLPWCRRITRRKRVRCRRPYGRGGRRHPRARPPRRGASAEAVQVHAALAPRNPTCPVPAPTNLPAAEGMKMPFCFWGGTAARRSETASMADWCVFCRIARRDPTADTVLLYSVPYPSASPLPI